MQITLSEALSFLNQSHPVAIPTETVWGLAAPLHDEKAILRVFELKNRPLVNPLIIHLHECEELLSYAAIPLPPGTKELASTFWPGPLTLVLPCQTNTIPALARASLPTAGFRVPKNKKTRELIRLAGPLVAPSANLSGRPSATEQEHVEEDFGSNFPCLESGETCECGIESTILVFKEEKWHVGRLGALSLMQIAPLLGYLPLQLVAGEKPLCPGQKFRHYAPKAHLTLSRSSWQREWKDTFEAVLGFEDRLYEGVHTFLSLGTSCDPVAAEKALYRSLRKLDQLKIKQAWVDCCIPYTGAWAPLMDRLEKASS